ncbi:hypothetical protein [Glycomyces sp. YM15]|uniref:hypothetical protein n=1 Tax=Glycomyces sp. YM15 TaxID=2800446 RepID=UPI001966631B|nr:hypothetical protein [Glycomyces sp. YM15]
MTVSDGHEAATAAAYGTVPSTYQEEGDVDLQLWVRVTVIEVGEGVSMMYGSVLVPERELRAEDGEIATVEQIHGSISVQS